MEWQVEYGNMAADVVAMPWLYCSDKGAASQRIKLTIDIAIRYDG